MTQSPPYCIQIELTEGCNLRCNFCGVNGIRGKERTYKFMTIETARKLATEIKHTQWNPRLEFTMHGEPTLNPNLIEIISIFHENVPKLNKLILSNGVGLVNKEHLIPELFNAGLNTLGLDEYQNVNYVPKIMKAVRSFNSLLDFRILEYPSGGADANPHQRKSFKRLIHIAPIDLSSKGTHSSLSNHCGAGMPKNEKGVGKRCAKPFREISFRYDGTVTICCNDWRGEMPVGNIHDISLHNLWNHPRFEAMRKKLYHGERDLGACVGCDFISYRTGLLPDSKGKQTLPRVDTKDVIKIEEMLTDGPLIKPVLREWEK